YQYNIFTVDECLFTGDTLFIGGCGKFFEGNATCSQDGFIHIFDFQNQMKDQNKIVVGNQKVHQGPIWKIDWAHPHFGNILASCSYDKNVAVHKEQQLNNQQKIWETIWKKELEGSINYIQFSPYECGFNIACGSSVGKVYLLVLRTQDSNMQEYSWQAHELGVNCICWEPFKADDDFTIDQVEKSNNKFTKLITGSCDKTLKIWSLEIQNGQLSHNLIYEIIGVHNDWIRDVAWSPLSQYEYDIIASCSEDQIVVVWKLNYDQNNNNYQQIEHQIINIQFNGPVWRLNWNFQGNQLSISSATQNNNNQVVIVQQNEDDEWVQVEEQNNINQN
ncbi:WD repeat protein, partial [Ichthyophthirius multifiliis]